MNSTSRESRSSLATATSHLICFAAFNAALNCGRRSSASEPLPVSTSVKSAVTSKPSAGEGGNSRALGLEAKAGTALLLSADTVVGDRG